MSAAEIARAKEAIRHMVLSLDAVRVAGSHPIAAGTSSTCAARLRASMKQAVALIDLNIAGRDALAAIVACSTFPVPWEYTRLFLHFLHAVTDARKRVHSFLSARGSQRDPRAQRPRTRRGARRLLGKASPTGRGGTRIGVLPRRCNKQWRARARRRRDRAPDHDGLERDPDDRLAFEIDLLHRSCAA